MVVTDNEAILGIGDQGAGGMAISVGKLALYCVGAGIHPASTLPISLDVGTNNRVLLDDPLYLGWRQERLTGSDYLELVDEFVNAAKAVFPDVLIQWEDFRKENALDILDRFAEVLPSFNDDIQGTGAVAAGMGIARQLHSSLRLSGLSEAESKARILAMDSRGIISDARPGLDKFKRQLAWPEEKVRSLQLHEEKQADLASVVRAFGAEVLIGTSGQANNVFVFPGIGLGTIVSGATRVTDSMIAAASEALATTLSDSDLREGRLVPHVSRLWDVCGEVGMAVAKQAIVDNAAPPMSDAELADRMVAYRWAPRYPEIVCSKAYQA